MTKKSSRESNFELLRILAIFMIVCFHYMLKGDWAFEACTFNRYIQKGFLALGELGVNLFMLISGYFMAVPDAKRKWNKVFSIYVQTVFYILLIRSFDIFVLKNGVVLNLDFLVRIFVPWISDPYWFVTVYLLIYILSPYINSMIFSLSQKAFREFLIIALVFWCMIPTAVRFLYGTSELGFYYNRFIWLTVVYCIGAYIRIYGLKKTDSLPLNIGFSVGIFLLMNLINIAVEVLPRHIDGLVLNESLFWEPNTILMLVLSVVVFNTFRVMKIKCIPWINLAAGTTLGIYMLHDSYLAPNMWSFLKGRIQTGHVFTDILAGATVVFILAGCVELCRQAAVSLIWIVISRCKVPEK